jgi:hypothetical protein
MVMVVLLGILSTIGIGFISSCISFFLQWLYKWNPIGQKYLILLRLIKTKIKGKKAKKRFQNLMKPLGYCVYCQSTWIAILLTIFLLGFNPLYIVMSIGTNYFFVEKLNRFLYQRY